MNSPRNICAERAGRADDICLILQKHYGQNAFARKYETIHAVFNNLPTVLQEEIRSDMHDIALEWIRSAMMLDGPERTGMIFDAHEIFKYLNFPTHELYEVIKECEKDNFGDTYDEYLLMCEHGTDEEIDRSIAQCSSAKFFYQSMRGRVRETVLAIRKIFEEEHGHSVAVYGSEWFVPDSFLQQYDLIAGVSTAGVSMPAIASAVGHPNTAVVDYHRHLNQAPRWKIQPTQQSAEKILLCDNDAVSGKTIQEVSNFLRERFSECVIDAFFTGDLVEQKSVSVASSIHGINSVLCASQHQQPKTFSRIRDVLVGLENKKVQHSA